MHLTMPLPPPHRVKGVLLALWVVLLLAGCARLTASPSPAPSPAPKPSPTPLTGTPALGQDQIATLSSLKQLDDYPLYTMRYTGAYPSQTAARSDSRGAAAQGSFQHAWGCSLFAALGDPDSRLYGRNFDWRFSPALLLYTDPPDGYASVSMVDIEYLGFGGEQAKNLVGLSLEDLQALLEAPLLPFDGLNERGLAIGMAAVPPGEMQPDPDKPTLDQLAVMRAVLDHAATVAEAVDILSSYNIDMGSVPVHYLVASSDGTSALVEFYQGEMVIFKNENTWQLATNFLLAANGGAPQGQCHRYDRISQRLAETAGSLRIPEALTLLSEVSQDNPGVTADTQWSIVYDLSAGEIQVVMGREYKGQAHTLHLNLAQP